MIDESLFIPNTHMTSTETQTDDALEHDEVIRAIAAKLKSQFKLSCELQELVSLGYQGLLEAKQRFDPSKGVSFRAFAFYRIRGAMIDGVRKMAHLPPRIHARLKAALAEDDVSEPLHRAQNVQASCRPNVERTLETLEGALASIATAYVVACVATPNERRDYQSPDEDLLTQQSESRVAAAISMLPAQEQVIVRGFYFEGRKFEEIARELGLSKSWVSRIHARALSLMREHLEAS